MCETTEKTSQSENHRFRLVQVICLSMLKQKGENARELHTFSEITSYIRFSGTSIDINQTTNF